MFICFADLYHSVDIVIQYACACWIDNCFIIIYYVNEIEQVAYTWPLSMLY